MVTPRPAWLTRRRFLLGAGTAVGVGAAAGAGVGIDRALAGGPAGASAVPDVELAAQPACPPASTRGPRTSPPTGTATRSRRSSTGCCSST